MLKPKNTEKKAPNKLDVWVRANHKSNLFIGLIALSIFIRFIVYLYFGARFLIDSTFVLAVVSLLLMITNKFNYKEPKKTRIRTYFKWFKLVVLTIIISVLYLDTFIASKDVYTIISNTDEEFIYSYDLEGEGRRYFTTSSEDIKTMEQFPAYELSGWEITEQYFINSETGKLVNENGSTYIRK